MCACVPSHNCVSCEQEKVLNVFKFTCCIIFTPALSKTGTACVAMEISTSSVRLTWFRAFTEYFHNISLKHAHVVQEFSVEIQVMEYTIQGLKANTEFDLNLDIDIYDGNGAHSQYQRLLDKRS